MITVDKSVGCAQFVYVVGLCEAIDALLDKTKWSKSRLQRTLNISFSTYYRWTWAKKPYVRLLGNVMNDIITLLRDHLEEKECSVQVFQYKEDVEEFVKKAGLKSKPVKKTRTLVLSKDTKGGSKKKK